MERNNLFFLILFVVSVGLAYVAIDQAYSTGEAVSSNPSCFDSDGGKVYDVQGYVQYYFKQNRLLVRRDFCANNFSLYEYYCTSKNLASVQKYTCSNGCRNGACVQQTTKTQQTLVIEEPTNRSTTTTTNLQPTLTETSNGIKTATLKEGVPSAPSDLKFRGGIVGDDGSMEIQLYWRVNSDNENGFEVEVKKSREGVWKSEQRWRVENYAGDGTGTLHYKPFNLPSNAEYSYRVKAYNDKGESDYSNEVNILIPTTNQITIPVEVCTSQDLDNIRKNLKANYIQICDIDFKDYSWYPIGTRDLPFKGGYDGNGKIISNLKIIRGSLFGDSLGIIKNVNIKDVTIEHRGMAGLVSINFAEGTIENVSISGVAKKTSPQSFDNIGGIVGINRGTIRESSSSVDLDIPGDGNTYRFGGLVAVNEGIIENSHATGYVNINSTIGGVGGLIGFNTGGVRNSYSTGQVNHNIGLGTGGLIGIMYTDGNKPQPVIENSYATGKVIGQDRTGGLVGYQIGGSIKNSYALGGVHSIVEGGGLVGHVTITNTDPYVFITNSYATGDVIGTPDIDGRSASVLGGLIGQASNSVTINNSYSSGSVQGGSFIGGLVGIAGGGPVIQNSYSKGNITGIAWVGGLIGKGQYNTYIYNSYSSGSITVVDDVKLKTSCESCVGGIIGEMQGEIKDSYSTKDIIIKETNSDYIGGLVGRVESGSISNSYSVGKISAETQVTGDIAINCSGSISVESQIIKCLTKEGTTIYYPLSNKIAIKGGGLIGKNQKGIINSSYWDKDMSGLTTSDGGEGKTTQQMKQKNTYTGWDFTKIWNIEENKGYPTLK